MAFKEFSRHFPPLLAYFSNCSNCSCNCIAESSFLSWNFMCISPTTFWYLVLALLFWNSISCGELKRNKKQKHDENTVPKYQPYQIILTWDFLMFYLLGRITAESALFERDDSRWWLAERPLSADLPRSL